MSCDLRNPEARVKKWTRISHGFVVKEFQKQVFYAHQIQSIRPRFSLVQLLFRIMKKNKNFAQMHLDEHAAKFIKCIQKIKSAQINWSGVVYVVRKHY